MPRPAITVIVPIALALAGCTGRAADLGTTMVIARSEEAPSPFDVRAPIVDICKARDKHAPVCVLLEDGRVACAHVQADHFEPPLAGISEAVEIACGDHGVCVREASGAVTCLDATGELRKPEALARARSLAPDCAVLEHGAVACWDESWTVQTLKLPRLAFELGGDDAERLDLLRVGLRSVGSSESGCGLHSSGALWCWGHTANGGEPRPSKVHTFEQPTKVRELTAAGPTICWREDLGWQCTDGKSPPESSRACDHGECTCMFHSDGWCSPQGERKPDAEMTVEGVSLQTDDCVVDTSGRVWCMNWPRLPPVVMGLTLAGQTTRLAPFTGSPPTPEPSPLPDPAAAKCPAGARVANQVCGPLRQPGAALACRSGQRTCPCTANLQWFDEDACKPEGFEFINALGAPISELDGWHTFVVHVDGAQVALGPELKIQVDDVDRSGAATLFELLDERDDGDAFYYQESELAAVVICALVDGTPACSAPLTRSWDYTEGRLGDEYDDGYSETARYRAKLEIVGSSVKVTVEAKTGKLDVSSRELPEYEGLRHLSSGTYPFAALLDQPFVNAPE